MAEFTWDVQIPGEDLPSRLETDYLLTEGEEVTVKGRTWIVESVTIDDDIADATGIIVVSPATDP